MAKTSTLAVYVVALAGVLALVLLAWRFYPSTPRPAVACQPRCVQADFSDQDLGRLDLSHTDFTLANLRGAKLEGATFVLATLSGAILREADLRATDFSNARLDVADLRRANLAGAVLRSADLRMADLRDADLSAADLRAAQLDDARLDRTILVKRYSWMRSWSGPYCVEPICAARIYVRLTCAMPICAWPSWREPT